MAMEGHGRSVKALEGDGRPWKVNGRRWEAMEGRWKALEGDGRPWKVGGRRRKAMGGHGRSEGLGGGVAYVAVREHGDRELLLDEGDLVEMGGAVAAVHGRAPVTAVHGEQRAARRLQLAAEAERRLGPFVEQPDLRCVGDAWVMRG